jgi:catechol-2,3-dioxygenase
MTLNHLHFASRRAEQTRAFYEEYFGFRLSRQLPGTAVLCDGHGFLLAIDDRKDSLPETLPEGTAQLHIGFCLDTPEQVETLYGDMKARSVPFRGELTRLSANALHFYCQDPTGNQIEVGWFRGLQPETRSFRGAEGDEGGAA